MPTSLRSFVQMAIELGYEEEDPTTATTLTPFDPQGGNEGEGRGERDEEGQPDLLGDLGQLSYTNPHYHQGQGQEYDQRYDRSDTLDGDPHYNHSIHPFSNDDIIGHNSDPSSPRTETPLNNNVPKLKIKFQKAIISPFNYTLSSLSLNPTTTTTTTTTTTNANNSGGSCKIVPPSKEGGDFIPPPKLAVPAPQTHTSTTTNINNNTSSGTIGSSGSSGGMVGPGSSSVHSSTATTPISNEKGRRKGQNYD